MSRHRVTQQWLGKPIETLSDLLRPDLRAVCVGINPALRSFAAGHYYQGRLGQRFFGRLRAAGVLPDNADAWEDDLAFAAGIGFTDIVKRPTASAKELTPADFAHGRPLLIERLLAFRPAVVVFTFKRAAVECIGAFPGCGMLRDKRVGGSSVFVMPSPYAPVSEVGEHLGTLRSLIGT